MPTITIDKRQVPVTARNGRQYNSGTAVSNTSTGGSDPGSGGLTLHDLFSSGAHTATGGDAKTVPADADVLPLVDSADSSLLKRLTWGNIKSALQNFFDPIYKPEVWEYLEVPGLQVYLAGANDPTLTTLAGGLKLYTFSGTALNEVFFIVKLPRSWKAGSDIYPAVNWLPMVSPASTQAVYFSLEYQWVSVGGVFSGVTNTTVNTADLTGTVGYTNKLTSFTNISGVGKVAGSTLVCRFYRDPTSINDYYTSSIGLLDILFHIQKDSLGSSSL